MTTPHAVRELLKETTEQLEVMAKAIIARRSQLAALDIRLRQLQLNLDQASQSKAA